MRTAANAAGALLPQAPVTMDSLVPVAEFGTSERFSPLTMQPHPTVSRSDVERVVRRDFPPDRFDEVIATLDDYGTQDWQRELDRVQLAVLKLAAGNLEGLRRYIEWAKKDYRDVLGLREFR